MSKNIAAKRNRNVPEQTAAIAESPAKSGPPEFLIKATDAVNTGAYDVAIEFLKEGIQEHPVTAYNGIGDIYLQQGENEKAMEWLEKARKCNPESGAIMGSIGRVLTKLGRKEEATEMLIGAIKTQEDRKELNFLIESMHQMGKYKQAIVALEERLKDDSSNVNVMFELAMWLENDGLYLKAEYWLKKILEIDQYIHAYNRLGLIYFKMDRMSDSVRYLKEIVEIVPNDAPTWCNLARSVMQMGRIEEGVRMLRKAVNLNTKDHIIHSNLLFRLHYLPNLDRQMIFEEHKLWGQRHAPISMAKKHHNNSVEPDRKLRIGYISPDYTNHVVSSYIEPLLDAHDRDQVEVYGYGNVERSDSVTDRLIKKLDRYRNIWGVDDDDVARVIEQDKIDILIELAGHTRGNRLLVMARKPAPIQVTYLGYADTTGVEAIDYILTDNMTTPPELQKYYTEELFPLPGGILCYTPSDEAPDVTPPPVIENGYITFGVFTTNRRFNQPLLEAWAEILKLCPNSRLLFGFGGGDDEKVQNKYFAEFAKLGISQDRLTMRGKREYADYLKQHREVDIALDTYPENGGTTTCNALWMGVPVVSLVGEHQVSRYGLSMLTRIGLEFFAAESHSEYTAKAVALASKPESLVDLRKSMRTRMRNSALCDKKLFTRYVEMGYREMWHRWCQKQGLNNQAD